MVRQISEDSDYSDRIWLRNNYFRIQAFVHFQFQAPKFTNMVKYAWYKCGFLEHRPEEFKTPLQVCLQFEELENCSYLNCPATARIKCAHCLLFFCYKHCIFNNLHINCQNV